MCADVCVCVGMCGYFAENSKRNEKLSTIVGRLGERESGGKSGVDPTHRQWEETGAETIYRHSKNYQKNRGERDSR